jgi:hypothetical protein
VLVADARRLEWGGRPDEQLKAVVTGAIQLVTVRERAAAAGISHRALSALLAPVPVKSASAGGLGHGRSLEGVEDQVEAGVELVALVVAGLQDVPGGELGEVGVLAGGHLAGDLL